MTNDATSTDNFFEVGASIAGVVYIDATGVGLDDTTNLPAAPGDTLESGVTVQLLTGPGGTVLATRTVGSNGAYLFPNLVAGSYYVQEIVPSGYVQTGPDSLTYTVPLAAGQNVVNDNFSNYQTVTPCQVTGIKYTDVSNCGQTSTFTDLGGNTDQGDTVTVTFTTTMVETLTLVSYNAPNANAGSGAALAAQTIYDVDTETFQPGKHTLTVTIPNNYYQIDFVCGGAISTFNPNAGITYHNENRFIDSDNGGTQAYGLSTLSGTDFYDANKNHSYGSGDSTLSNVKIALTGTDFNGNSVNVTTTTSSNGSYSFKNVVPGVYTITETSPSGYAAETTIAGSVGGSSGTGVISTINLNSNTAATGYNFGNVHSSGYPQLAAGSTSTVGAGVGEIIGSTQLHTGTLTVAVNLPWGPESGAEQAAIAQAIASLNAQVAPLGVTLVEVNGASAASADIHINMGTSSPIGGVHQGVLGSYSADGDITLIQGWDWYFGTKSSQISSNQYDFQSVVTHELGHALGLGENSDSASAMDLYLKPGQAHRNLTTTDLGAIQQELGTNRISLATSQVSAAVPNPVLSSSLFYSRSQAQSQTLPLASSFETDQTVEIPSNRSVKIAAKLKTPSSVVTQPISQAAASASDQSVVDTVPLTDTLSLGSTISLINAGQKASSQGMALDQVIDDLYGLGGSSIDLG